MYFKFSQYQKSEDEVGLIGIEALKCKPFKCIGLTLKKNCIGHKDVTHSTKLGLLKRRKITGFRNKK